MPNQAPAASAPPPGLLRLGVALSGLTMLAGLATFALSLEHAGSTGGKATKAGTVVNVTASGCEPAQLEVPAGRRTFTVVNQSNRAVEWEIIDGVMVLAERENIAPGLRQPLTVDLAAGTYAITCGLLSNPHGELKVVASDNGAPPTPLSKTAFIGPLAEYRVYTTLELRKLQAGAKALAAAIDSGDLERAKAAYDAARRADMHLAMPIGLFSDLDQRLNARAEDFARRDQDPDFAGFHRLAIGLFDHGSTVDLAPIADQLVTDAAALKTRLDATAVPASQLADGTARVLGAWSDRQRGATVLTTQDLADLKALTEGAHKVVTLLSPLLASQSPETLTSLQSSLATLEQRLPSSAGAAEPPGDSPPAGAAPAVLLNPSVLLKETQALADSLADVNAALTQQG
ncbi:multidrug DMT transporter permease [Salinicola rhizosphaerae]|uniref:Multidrug DMT transporter permease n=2 Tax=Salinicola rhizosphaerae TaxID=1443141 RepID=A0ABQ3E2I6_9GAMM|nr:multidrug DMT transporter permease [Salinicola rhizosphaerae]